METLRPYINLVQDVVLRKWVENELKTAPKTFWKIPASSSGKHHPDISNGVGGLVRHTRIVIDFALIFCRAYNIVDKENIDEIICACLLHDIDKPSHDHAEITFNNIMNDTASERIQRIANMIRYHMGRWTKNGKQVSEYTQQEWIIHLADMAATNKNIVDYRMEI